jgi:predicted DsbA family dithiol-disulfide isomerase
MTIDVYADVACPWCYIGHARLRTALSERDDLTPTIRWNPFQLQPDMPAGGREWRAFAEEKFGGWERAQQMFERVEAAADQEGLSVHFDRMTTAPNTADAHRLILWAQDGGPDAAPIGESPGERLAESLYRAYFEKGANVSDPDALVAAAEEAGCDPDEARSLLDGEAFAEAVDESQQRAERLNIQGVPCYVFGERYALAGAQPPEKIHQAIAAAQGAAEEGAADADAP